MSEYTKDEIEKRCLQEISSREGSSLYSSEILDKCTNILDILNNYKSCNPPIELLLQNLPKLMPRPYSICNSPLGSPDVLKVCFSVIKKENGSTGLTTGWLNDLVKESKDLSAKFEKLSLDSVKIPMYIRKPNTFRLPENKKTAIIMIGCGTGVAPFIGFLEERSHIKINEKKTLGPALLYFGCRYFDKDYIYKEELENFVKDEVLSKLRLSFSREIGTVKYVQVSSRNTKQIKECFAIFLISNSDAYLII